MYEWKTSLPFIFYIFNMNNFGLEYHLVDSCNLKCAGCSHYSSLLNKLTYKSVDQINNDLTLLKNKIGDNLGWLRLLGGEPLLHPNINDCLLIIYNIFPNTRLIIVTNGLLVNKMSQTFYDICKKYNIEIKITDYNILDLKNTILNLKNYGIKTSIYKSNSIWKYQCIKKNNEITDYFSKCTYKNMCNNYNNGKIYLCPRIAYINIFNNFFNENIQLDESDYIDINEINSYEELQDKLKKLTPHFCYHHCNPTPINGKWKKTNKNINEFCLI